ncbi:MAG: LssY C-terminal domain-containing protein [Acidobacteria bacterium]|nr:LssY C-terminal domain-containing protein [Acidobacteriota bacterium]
MKLATSAWMLLAIALPAAELPVGTQIQIRLQAKVGSSQSKSGEAVKAVVIAPVYVAGQAVVPQGSTITGTVKEAQPPKDSTERARLVLEFGELSGAGAKPVKLAAQVTEVDNARETVDENGAILGILGSETLSSQMDKALEKLGQRSSGLAGILVAAKAAILKPADVEITYEPGVEMTLQLSKATPVSGRADAPPIPGADELAGLVSRQPFQTMAEKPPQPSDLTNLMFIGSRERLEAAFAAAGWMTAEKLNSKSGLETFRAIAENRGYQQAPVSTLLLDGKKPDLVFQKQNNTFAKRHHLRIWKRPDQFHGQEVWVAAATHDIGIEFSAENRTFIHKIDSQIDRERAKVVNDLLLTGQVKGLALVERPEAPRQSQNATGDKLSTDGGMAVLVLGER